MPNSAQLAKPDRPLGQNACIWLTPHSCLWIPASVLSSTRLPQSLLAMTGCTQITLYAAQSVPEMQWCFQSTCFTSCSM